MLEIEIPRTEIWDNENEMFSYVDSCKLVLEHSLISISKWESKWNKPFLTRDEKTPEEMIDYVKCMTINRVDSVVFSCLTNDNYKQINDYIAAPMTATTFRENGGAPRGNREIMTAEVIYFYMISFGIPFECEKWHINRLLTLIRVCSIKNSPSKKMSKSAAAKQQRTLNAQRRAKAHSKG